MAEQDYVTIDLSQPVNGISQLKFPSSMSEDEMATAIRKFYSTNPEKSFIEKGVEAVDATIEWFKGGKRDPNIPLANQANLGLPNKEAAMMVSLLATTANDERLASGIKKIIPNAEFDKDEYGNLIAIVPQYKDGQPTQQFKRFYPNPKGLDVTDLMQASGALTAGGAIAKTLGTVGLPYAGMAGGALIGFTEAGLVEMISSKLSDAKFKLEDLAYGTGFGALGVKAAEFGAKIMNIFRRSPESIFDQTGKLLPKWEKSFTEAGIDPGTVTRETATEILKKVRSGVNVDEASRLAQAENLPVPVPLNQGAVTGSQGQQLFEDAAQSGAFGQTAETMMTGARTKTDEALQANIPAITSTLANKSPTISNVGEAGEVVQDVLVAQRAEALDIADKLYDEARASGSAFVDQDQSIGMLQRINQEMSENYDFSTIPKTAKFIEKMSTIIDEGGDVKKLFGLRQQITSLGKELGTEGSAARALKDKLDDELTESLNTSLIYGDEAAVTRWKTAIANWKDFSRIWNSKGGLLKKLTEKSFKDSTELQLVVSPQEASNAIFGVSRANLSSNVKLATNIETLKRQLPEDVFNQIKQEAFIRIANAGKTGARDAFSGVKFRTEWRKLSKNNRAMINALFTNEEKKLIDQFANVAALATGGRGNTSNTANQMFNLLGRLGAAIGSTSGAQFLTRVVGAKMLREAYGGARAASATRGNPTTFYSGQGAGAGGAFGTQEEPQSVIENQINRTTGYMLGR